MLIEKWIHTDSPTRNKLSRTAHALMLPIIFLSNNQNEINKRKLINTVSWIRDTRTWNKYWQELVEAGVLVQLDQHMWMISPYECYPEGASHKLLVHRWDEARNAAAS